MANRLVRVIDGKPATFVGERSFDRLEVRIGDQVRVMLKSEWMDLPLYQERH